MLEGADLPLRLFGEQLALKESGPSWKGTARLTGIHLAFAYVSISAVEQPPFRCPNRHSTMPARVPDKRYQENPARGRSDYLNAVEPKPLLTLELVDHPMRAVRPMLGDVGPLKERESPGCHRRLILPLEDMDPCPWKIGQASRMIDMKVRQDDVLNVFRREAERGNLSNGSLLQITNDPIGLDECAY